MNSPLLDVIDVVTFDLDIDPEFGADYVATADDVVTFDKIRLNVQKKEDLGQGKVRVKARRGDIKAAHEQIGAKLQKSAAAGQWGHAEKKLAKIHKQLGGVLQKQIDETNAAAGIKPEAKAKTPKDRNRLVPKQITDKNGYKKTVMVKPEGEDEPAERDPKKEKVKKGRSKKDDYGDDQTTEARDAAEAGRRLGATKKWAEGGPPDEELTSRRGSKKEAVSPLNTPEAKEVRRKMAAEEEAKTVVEKANAILPYKVQDGPAIAPVLTTSSGKPKVDDVKLTADVEKAIGKISNKDGGDLKAATAEAVGKAIGRSLTHGERELADPTLNGKIVVRPDGSLAKTTPTGTWVLPDRFAPPEFVPGPTQKPKTSAKPAGKPDDGDAAEKKKPKPKKENSVPQKPVSISETKVFGKSLFSPHGKSGEMLGGQRYSNRETAQLAGQASAHGLDKSRLDYDGSARQWVVSKQGDDGQWNEQRRYGPKEDDKAEHHHRMNLADDLKTAGVAVDKPPVAAPVPQHTVGEVHTGGQVLYQAHDDQGRPAGGAFSSKTTADAAAKAYSSGEVWSRIQKDDATGKNEVQKFDGQAWKTVGSYPTSRRGQDQAERHVEKLFREDAKRVENRKPALGQPVKPEELDAFYAKANAIAHPWATAANRLASGVKAAATVVVKKSFQEAKERFGLKNAMAILASGFSQAIKGIKQPFMHKDESGAGKAISLGAGIGAVTATAKLLHGNKAKQAPSGPIPRQNLTRIGGNGSRSGGTGGKKAIGWNQAKMIAAAAFLKSIQTNQMDTTGHGNTAAQQGGQWASFNVDESVASFSEVSTDETPLSRDHIRTLGRMMFESISGQWEHARLTRKHLVSAQNDANNRYEQAIDNGRQPPAYFMSDSILLDKLVDAPGGLTAEQARPILNGLMAYVHPSEQEASRVKRIEFYSDPDGAQKRADETQADGATGVKGFFDREHGLMVCSCTDPRGWKAPQADWHNVYHEFAHSIDHLLTDDDWEAVGSEFDGGKPECLANAYVKRMEFSRGRGGPIFTHRYPKSVAILNRIHDHGDQAHFAETLAEASTPVMDVKPDDGNRGEGGKSADGLLADFRDGIAALQNQVADATANWLEVRKEANRILDVARDWFRTELSDILDDVETIQMDAEMEGLGRWTGAEEWAEQVEEQVNHFEVLTDKTGDYLDDVGQNQAGPQDAWAKRVWAERISDIFREYVGEVERIRRQVLESAQAHIGDMIQRVERAIREVSWADVDQRLEAERHLRQTRNDSHLARANQALGVSGSNWRLATTAGGYQAESQNKTELRLRRLNDLRGRVHDARDKAREAFSLHAHFTVATATSDYDEWNVPNLPDCLQRPFFWNSATFDWDETKHPRGEHGRWGAQDEPGDDAATRPPLTDTPAFKAWFGKSKLVDKEGKPLLFYHGGASGITEFDPKLAGSVLTSDWGKGIYFTTSEWSADGYRDGAAVAKDEEVNQRFAEYEEAAKRLGTTVMNSAIDLGFDSPKYNSLREYEGRWRDSLKRAHAEKKGEVYAVHIKMENPLYYTYAGMTDPFLDEQAKSHGHDGIVVTNEDGRIEEVIAFEPGQIKSATGNRGTFDPKSPNINFSSDWDETKHPRGEHGHWGSGNGGETATKTAVTETPAFKNWFRDSKVVDAAGKPMVVYHGTTAEFDVFDKQKGSGGGPWFASDPKFADIYAEGKGNIKPLYVSIQKPYTITNSPEDLLKWASDGQKWKLVQDGYDGVLIRHKDGVMTGYPFDTNQVKSAIGNRGTFDPKDPNINFAADWDEGKHPRGDHGRWTEDGGDGYVSIAKQMAPNLSLDKLSGFGGERTNEEIDLGIKIHDAYLNKIDTEWVTRAKQQGMSEEKANLMGKAMKQCFDYMRISAIEQVLTHMGGRPPMFYPDTKAVTASLNALRVSQGGPPIDEAKTTGGFWAARSHDKTGTLHIDGGYGNYPGVEGADVKWDEYNTLSDMKHIYAHELGHVLDGPGDSLSGSRDWEEVWAAEIYKGESLSKYACKNPSEGFAEFYRLLLTEPTHARLSFPRCYAFLRFRGLC